MANSVIKRTFSAHGGISIKLFVVYLHIINECLSYKFHPYSILTKHTKVVFKLLVTSRGRSLDFQKYFRDEDILDLPTHVEIDDFAMVLTNAEGIKKQIYFENPKLLNGPT